MALITSHRQMTSFDEANERTNAFIDNIPPYPSHYQGRGIVICGGGVRYFTNAWVCISILRELGCELPIQIWYLGPQELDRTMIDLVAPLGVECVDAYQIRKQHPARILNGWELKAYAILHSPFQEVLLLDADNVPVRNPEYLFEDRRYLETGAVFWPDFGRLQPDREAWTAFGVHYRDEPEFETGQILVHKQTCWRQLNLSMWYNEHSDFYYHYVHGDKETFHMAWRRLHTRYSMPPYPIHALWATMCQHDFQGRRLFQHRNMAKWSLTEQNSRIDDFWLETNCLRHLDILRQRWTGTLGAPPRPHPLIQEPRLREVFSELCTTLYTYIRVGHDERPMRFSPLGFIAIGRGGEETYWELDHLESQTVLTISSDSSPTCYLTRNSEGIWQGNWLRHERMPIELHPVRKLPVYVPEYEPALTAWETFTRRLVAKACPMSQNAFKDNLGFGYLYYGLVRNYQPDIVIVIGSAKGFSVMSAARGLQENGFGKLFFIDPSFSGMGHPGWSGTGYWDDPQQVRDWFQQFGLADWIEHLKMTSDQAFQELKPRIQDLETALVIIDGDHTTDAALRDFRNYSSLIRNGFVCMHDATNPDCGVREALAHIRQAGHPVTILDKEAGLALIEIRQKWKFEDKWNYLAENTRRGEAIYNYISELLHPSDSIIDMYCGSAPLAPYLQQMQVFGWDIDQDQIDNLRTRFPHQRWEAMPETAFFTTDLPDHLTVLLALGLSSYTAEWDPQWPAKNIEWTVRAYNPRLVVLEASTHFQDSHTLRHLQAFLQARNYSLYLQPYDPQLADFSQRILIIAQRK